jgi:hypothetical protein
MTAPIVAERVMKARRQSVCPICRRLIRPGDQIAKLGRWQHVEHVLDRQRQAADDRETSR